MSASGSMTGKVFGGRYRIEDRVGVGGMAEVYRAQDTVLGRTVAVKVMLAQYAADPGFTSRFRHEAAAAANLQSPYIVNVYDWGEDDGTYYIVMEYVRGSDLKTAIKQRGAINQRKVAEIGAQVCQALSVAHGLDIIHRDIKPQNIMVQPDGNVKVMDFGIAHAKNSTKDATGSVLGTAHYISPEQAQGRELTPTSDIYSLGVVLYEAATGKLPFDGPDAVSVATKQVSETPIAPREINPNISPDLEAIILCAMAKNPTDRFVTVNDMRLALNDFLAGRPVKLPGASGISGAETRVLNTMGAQPTAVIADGTQVMQSTGGRTASSGTPPEATNFTNQPVKKKSRKPVIAIVAIIVAVLIIGGIAFAVTSGSMSGEPVPDITDLTVDEATATLQDDGFEIGKISNQNDPNVKEGLVISQNPEANSRAEHGTRVDIVVSTGPNQVVVPNLVGMTAEQARSELQNQGLIASAGTPIYSSEVERGKVISQNPAANEQINSGSVVEYVLSLGPEVVAIPDVLGESESSATTTLENAGFTVSVKETTSDNYSSGTVARQEPSAGSRLEMGAAVTIYVSSGSSSVEVPSVIGYTIEEAEAALEDVGLLYDVQTTSSGNVGSGQIASQSPSAGSSASRGATVTIYVYRGTSSSTDNSSGSGSDEGSDTTNTTNTGPGSSSNSSGAGSGSGSSESESNNSGQGSPSSSSGEPDSHHTG